MKRLKALGPVSSSSPPLPVGTCWPVRIETAVVETRLTHPFPCPPTPTAREMCREHSLKLQGDLQQARGRLGLGMEAEGM